MDVPVVNSPEKNPNSNRKCTILVADDNRAIRALLVDVLGRHHHTVMAAADGAEALALAGRSNSAIDLLVADLDMPKLNGFELAAEIRGRFPGVRVILMSGAHTRKPDRAAFLKKVHHTGAAGESDGPARSVLRPLV
jgi:CheY-like chemotaxis protein